MRYPRLVTCSFTGVKAIVKSEQEEAAFRMAPLIGLAAAIVLCAAVAIAIGFDLISI